MTLLRPVAEREELGDPREVPDLIEDDPSPWAFSTGAYEVAEGLFSRLAVARRLSDLLRESIREGGEESADLVRLQALLAFGVEIDRVIAGQRVVVAVDDGQRLQMPGFSGADLLIAQVTPELVASAPRQSPARDSHPAQLRLLPRRADVLEGGGIRDY